MKNRGMVILGVVLGLVFVVIGIVYATHDAGSLPSFFPGYEAGSTHMHAKHSIASFVLAVLSFIFAWFQSGPKPSTD